MNTHFWDFALLRRSSEAVVGKDLKMGECGGIQLKVEIFCYLVAIEYAVAPKTISRNCDQEMTLVHNVRQIILEWLYKCRDEVFEANTLSTLCWRLFSDFVPSCCDISEARHVW